MTFPGITYYDCYSVQLTPLQVSITAHVTNILLDCLKTAFLSIHQIMFKEALYLGMLLVYGIIPILDSWWKEAMVNRLLLFQRMCCPRES